MSLSVKAYNDLKEFVGGYITDSGLLIIPNTFGFDGNRKRRIHMSPVPGFQLLEELQQCGRLHRGDWSVLRTTVKEYCTKPHDVEAAIIRAEGKTSPTTININVGAAALAPPVERMIIEHHSISSVSAAAFAPIFDFQVDPKTQNKIQKVLLANMDVKDAKKFFGAHNRRFQSWYRSFVEDIDEKVEEIQKREEAEEQEEECKLRKREKRREQHKKEEEELLSLEEEEKARKRRKRLRKLRDRKSKKKSDSSNSDSDNEEDF